MTTPVALKQRVLARDRLVLQAEMAGADSGDPRLQSLVENLRVYQAELHAQADELSAAQARTEAVLTRFSALFSSMPVAALLVAFNGEVLEHNAQASRLFRLRPRSVVTRFLHRLVDPQHYQDVVRPAFHEARSTGHGRVDNVVFVDDEGGRFIGELHIAALPSESGEVATFNCAVLDRTEHLQDLRALQGAADALRESEATLAEAARLARVGGWSLQIGDRSMHWSPRCRSRPLRTACSASGRRRSCRRPNGFPARSAIGASETLRTFRACGLWPCGSRDDVRCGAHGFGTRAAIPEQARARAHSFPARRADRHHGPLRGRHTHQSLRRPVRAG